MDGADSGKPCTEYYICMDYGFNFVPRTVYVGKMRHPEIHDKKEEEREVQQKSRNRRREGIQRVEALLVLLALLALVVPCGSVD